MKSEYIKALLTVIGLLIMAVLGWLWQMRSSTIQDLVTDIRQAHQQFRQYKELDEQQLRDLRVRVIKIEETRFTANDAEKLRGVFFQLEVRLKVLETRYNALNRYVRDLKIPPVHVEQRFLTLEKEIENLREIMRSIFEVLIAQGFSISEHDRLRSKKQKAK